MGKRIYTSVCYKSMHTNPMRAYDQYCTVRNWCAAYFGVSKYDKTSNSIRPWHAKRVTSYSELDWCDTVSAKFYFLDPTHATLFALTWA